MAVKPPPSELLETLALKKAALVVRALNHPLRLQILYLLHKTAPVSVTTLYRQLRLTQSVASQQLAILRQANLVLPIRQGKQVFYEVNYQRIKEVQHLAFQLLEQIPVNA